MLLRDDNGKQLSPCVIEWAKYALGVKSPPHHSHIRHYSNEYWNKTVDVVGRIEGKNLHQRRDAKNMYHDIFG